MNHLPTGLATSFAALMLLAGAFFVAVTPTAAAAEGAAPIQFGMESSSVSAQTNAGVKPDYGTFWIGPWTLSSGWAGPDAQLTAMKNAGVTPAIHFYYWGDDISPSCVEHGCWSSLHNAQKTRAGWDQLGTQLTSHLNSKMGGAPVVVFLESEFNKGGIETYEPFDGYMAAMADKIHAAYPNAIIVLGFGNWGSHAWGTFDRAAAASDMVGIQGMRGSTKQTKEQMMTLYDGLLTGVQTLGAKFPGKPIMITDVAVSSYPEPEYLGVQRDVLKEVFDNLATLKAHGVEAVIYRSWIDSPGMNLANYYGMAERYWGLANSAGLKPSAHVWIDGVKAERAGSTPAPPAPGPYTATVTPSASSNEWWIQVGVSGSPAKVETKVGSGSFVAMDRQSYGWTKSLHAPSGTMVQFRVTATDGQQATTPAQAWLVDMAPKTAVTTTTTTTTTTTSAPAAIVVGDGVTTQVESFTLKQAGGKQSDAQAQGGAMWNLWSNGAVAQPYDFSGEHDLTVRARGTPANGVGPHMDVYVAGVKVLAAGPGTAYADYHIAVAGSGPTEVRIVFTNDVRTSAEDRNLILDAVTLTPAPPPVPANEPPTAAFQATMDGLTASLDGSDSSDPDGDALSYAWSFGDGATALGRTASHGYAAAGTYTVVLTVSDGELSATASQPVTAVQPNRAPSAAFTATASHLALAVDASASTDPDGDALSYAWSFGNGATAAGKTAVHTYAAAGSYTVSLTVSDGQATATSSKAVHVTAPYAATFTTHPNSNEWWVQEKVVSSPAPAKVEVRVNGGAWQPMKLQGYGDWTLSTHVAKGSQVVFRATAPDGQTALSPSQAWLGGSTSTSTTSTAFKATFAPRAVGNDWWVETAVSANAAIAKVEAKVGNGSYVTLSKTDWGTYAKSIHAPNGSAVTFRATSSTGATATSGTVIWT